MSKQEKTTLYIIIAAAVAFYLYKKSKESSAKDDNSIPYIDWVRPVPIRPVRDKFPMPTDLGSTPIDDSLAEQYMEAREASDSLARFSKGCW